MSRCIIIVVLFVCTNNSKSSRPGYGGDLRGGKRKDPCFVATEHRESLNINFDKPGQWSVPNSQLKDWKAYLNMIRENVTAVLNDPDGISTGFPPPPWAIFPNRTGIARYCFLPPASGDCVHPNVNVLEDRWGYNPFKDHCEKFTFSGCDGNANRFMTKTLCEKHCKQVPKTSCNS